MGERVRNHQEGFDWDGHFEGVNTRLAEKAHDMLSKFDNPPTWIDVEEMTVNGEPVKPASMIMSIVGARHTEVIRNIEW